MRIYVRVSPRSSRNEVLETSPGEYKVKITAAPVDGEANKMLLKVLAKHFSVPLSCVQIVGGKTAKIKMVDITR